MSVAHLVDPELAKMLKILPVNDLSEIQAARAKYAILYAQRLMQAGVPTELHVYPGAPHGFDRLAPAAAVSRCFYADRDSILQRVFRAPS